MTSDPEFIVYSRPGCHLCELLLGELEPLIGERARVSVRNVDDRPEWLAAFGERVPVVCFEDQEICHYHLDRRAVLERIRSD